MWKKLDIGEAYPPHIGADDCVLHKHEHTTGRVSYDDPTRSKISNLKKDVKHKGSFPWHYKETAMREMAADLKRLIGDRSCYLIAMPTSKSRNDTDYDDRLEQVVTMVSESCPNVCIMAVFNRRKSVERLHHSANSRVPAEIADSLSLDFATLADDKPIILVDDVITTGATFVACRNMILEKLPNARIVGAFWARSVSRS